MKVRLYGSPRALGFWQGMGLQAKKELVEGQWAVFDFLRAQVVAVAHLLWQMTAGVQASRTLGAGHLVAVGFLGQWWRKGSMMPPYR